MANKIKPTSPDKVKGKFVKYRKGDCFSINCGNGKFLAAFISEKFNKYYDFTLIEYYDEKKPSIGTFLDSKFDAVYIDSSSGSIVGVSKQMILCKTVDDNNEFEKIGEMRFGIAW